MKECDFRFRCDIGIKYDNMLYYGAVVNAEYHLILRTDVLCILYVMQHNNIISYLIFYYNVILRICSTLH